MTKDNKGELFLILNNLRNAYNVGFIFSTADGAGVTKIYLCGITPTPPMHKVVGATTASVGAANKISKTALGAERTMPWEYHKQTWRLLKKLRDNGLWFIALEQTKKSKNIFSYKLPKNKKVALIVGNEVRGLNKKNPVLHRQDY